MGRSLSELLVIIKEKIEDPARENKRICLVNHEMYRDGETPEFTREEYLLVKQLLIKNAPFQWETDDLDSRIDFINDNIG